MDRLMRMPHLIPASKGVLLANRIYHWGDPQSGKLSLETIRTLHQPHERFRVSYNRYDAGVSFDGEARARRLYVIDGACTVSMGAEEWDLCTDDYADLPEGRFQFSVPPSACVKIVSVYSLP